MRIRHRRTASTFKSVCLTENSTPPLSCNSNSSTETTMHQLCTDHVDCTSPNPCHSSPKSLNTTQPTRTKATQSSMLNTLKNQVSHSPGFSSSLFLFPIFILMLSCWQTVDAQLPFENSNHRFFGYANNKTPRDILLSVVKNISEESQPGELLLNFRAEDRSNPTFNLS